MKTWIAIPLLAALPALPFPWLEEPPAWLEPWMHNARERTLASREAFDERRFDEAVEAARTAHRLEPDDPRTELNLGTSLLAAERTDEALESLTRAADRLESEVLDGDGPADEGTLDLASTAHYNRGNALLASDDLSGAVEAYEQALRRRPGHLDAKHNLEVALERLRQRQEQQQQQQQQQDGDGEGGENPQPGDSEDESEEGPGEGRRPEPEDGSQGEEPSPAPPGESETTQPQQGDPRLPRFEDQPDMTAQEAAAILEAVENLEREQRRLEATERARNQARTEKDW